MAESRKRQAFTYALTFCAFLLFVLFFYLWNFDYNPRPKDAIDSAPKPAQRGVRPAPPMAAASLSAHVRVDSEETGPRAPRRHLATLEITNTGTATARILDAVAPGLLYELRLTGPNNRRLPLNRTAAAKARAHSSGEYKVIDLLPGRSLGVRFELSDLFDLSRPGTYRFQAVYQSRSYARTRKLNLMQKRVASVSLPADPVSFEVKAPKSNQAATDASAEGGDARNRP